MQITREFSPAASRREDVPTFDPMRRALRPALLVLIAAAAVAVGWTGFIASDDHMYYLGALQWINDPPFAGVDHWTTRYPVVLTLAAAVLSFGGGPLAMSATSLFWYAAFVAAGAQLTRRIAGSEAAWIAALFLATMPVVATAASIVNCDLPEATFLLVGASLLVSGLGRQPQPMLSVAAGICFGLAVLSRETALLALSAMAVFLILGRPAPRPTILWAAVGGALVMLADLLFQWAMTGDPFRRYDLAINHDPDLSRAGAAEGNLLVHPALDPVLVLFFNNEFALLFWIAAAAILFGFYRRLRADQRAQILLIGGLALASFVMIALLSMKLVLNPRYFTYMSAVAAIVSAIWLVRLSPAARNAVLFGAIAANFLMLSLQNPHPQWPSQALVAAAAAHPEAIISADGSTVARADLPLKWAMLNNVRSGGSELQLVQADAVAGQEVLERYPAPPRPLGRLLMQLQVDRFVPGAVQAKLFSTGPELVLVRSKPQG